MHKILLPAFLLLYIAATAQNRDRFRTMLNSYYEEYLKLNPSVATSLGDYRYNDRLENNISASYRYQSQQLYSRYLDSLKSFNKRRLSARDQLSYEIFNHDLSNNLNYLTYPVYYTPVNQMFDYRLSFSQLGGGSGDHPFKTVKDYDDFLKRINDFVTITDTAIANMRVGMATHRVHPTVLMEKVIPQLKAMIVDTVANSLFYNPVKNMPATFPAEEKQRLTKAYTTAIRQQIIPAYSKLLGFIEKEYMPFTRGTVAISDVPGGKEEYAFLVKYHTTTNLTPDEVFTIGENEVKRIQAEMEKVKQQAGFSGDLKSFFHYVFTDPKFFPFKKDEDVVAAFNNVYNKIKPHLPGQFNMVPKTAFEIRPVEKYRAASAAAHYMQGTTDGTRPGIFYFPVLNATTYSYWRMEDLFLHEAIPGHHYQISLQLENPEVPGFQKVGSYGAYVEGWGLYAESLGEQLGVYTDPYQKLGQLYGEIHRAIRLVVDAGMHHKGWTREQAIQYSLDNEPIASATAIQEIERYIAWPGQALSYKIGELTIKEKRSKAQKSLGDKFDIRAFHDEVLKDGGLPLKIFEAKMDRWIKSQR